MRLDELLGYNLRRASNAAMGDLSRRLAGFGLRPTLYAILLAIDELERPSQSEVGRQLSIQRANMVPLLTELEATGWIERKADPADRRSRLLSIAPARRSELDSVRAAVLAHERDLVRRAGIDAETLRLALARIWGDDRSAKDVAARLTEMG